VNDDLHKPSDTVSIVIIGHVDSGKSTLAGQLLQQLKEVSKK
jgi:translation elongation factor EF-1alpha